MFTFVIVEFSLHIVGLVGCDGRKEKYDCHYYVILN